jgi:DNA ligase (NAD+)
MTKTNDQIINEERADELEYIIGVLDTLYEAGEECVHPITNELVSDTEYDVLRSELKELRPESDIFNAVTASSLKTKRAKIKHDPPMTSITKADGTIEKKNARLKKWIKEVIDELEYDLSKNDDSNPFFVMSYKHDGVAISLVFKNGILVSAGKRPQDGISGDDITDLVKWVDNIPLQLSNPYNLVVRGEIECRISDFENILQDFENGKNPGKLKRLPANPRNHTAGSLSLDDADLIKHRKLSFTAYSIENFEEAPYRTELERSKWCYNELGIPFVRLSPFKYTKLAELEKNVDKLDYEVDGVVLSVNNLEDAEQLGRYGGSATGDPKGKLAWKFNAHESVVKITGKVFETSRTGIVTPVATFDGVRLDGTIVTKCTLNNVGFMKRNKIDVGAEIGIIKAGKIIPKAIKVYKPAKDVSFPKNCPSCNEPLKIREGQSYENGNKIKTEILYCPNKTSCQAQNVRSLVHYLSTIGCKGLAESVTSQLVGSGLVKTFADFYELKISDLTKLGIGNRTSILSIARIHMISDPDQEKDDRKLMDHINLAISSKKKIPLEKLFASLGISGAGETVGRLLAEQFRDFDVIRKASEEQLLEVDGIGDITAKDIFVYFKANKDNIDRLLAYVEPILPKQGKLTGLQFVFTGSPQGGKTYWQNKVREEGGTIGSSVSKKTNYVVVGDDPGSKLDKAKKLGIKTITTEELEKLLN